MEVGEKARREEIAQRASIELAPYWGSYPPGDSKLMSIILHAIAESHQSKTEQPEPKTCEGQLNLCWKALPDSFKADSTFKCGFGMGFKFGWNEGRGNDAGATLLSKESEVAATIRAREVA